MIRLPVRQGDGRLVRIGGRSHLGRRVRRTISGRAARRAINPSNR